MIDGENTELDRVLAKIERGEDLEPDEVARFLDEARPLSEKRVGDRLHVARDKVLHIITRTLLIGKMVSKDTVRVFNTLQYAAERHDLIHAPKDKTDLNDESKYRRITHVFPISGDTTDP